VPNLIVAALLTVISIGSAELAEEIGEGLVSEFLEVLHAVFGEQVEGVPSLVIKLNALPRHGALSRRRVIKHPIPATPIIHRLFCRNRTPNAAFSLRHPMAG
jgi:hypothetical protein